MRRLACLVIIAAVLSACGDVVIGPVDHSCHAQPDGTMDDGSGCGPGRG